MSATNGKDETMGIFQDARKALAERDAEAWQSYAHDALEAYRAAEDVTRCREMYVSGESVTGFGYVDADGKVGRYANACTKPAGHDGQHGQGPSWAS